MLAQQGDYWIETPETTKSNARQSKILLLFFSLPLNKSNKNVLVYL